MLLSNIPIDYDEDVHGRNWEFELDDEYDEVEYAEQQAAEQQFAVWVQTPIGIPLTTKAEDVDQDNDDSETDMDREEYEPASYAQSPLTLQDGDEYFDDDFENIEGEDATPFVPQSPASPPDVTFSSLLRAACDEFCTAWHVESL